MTQMCFSIIHILATINYKKKKSNQGVCLDRQDPRTDSARQMELEEGAAWRRVTDCVGFLFTQLNPDSERARERPVDLAQSV